MTSSGQDDTSPPPELQGLDPKDLLLAGLETVPPVTLPPQPLDPDATMPVSHPQSTKPAAQVELPLPEELTQLLPAGNYHVERFLGQGGMGAVYKGTQVRLKRPVAIKIMRRDLGKDYDFEARFEREAQAMAKLNHPNIVSVIDFGEAGPDYLYIVMELIDGADLMDVIRGGQMTQEMALSLLPQICDALQFAHDHGIVHRDIKPSNIMLTRDGRVKMCDFGLAKRYDVESSFRTQTGTGMGTPDYAAPEQFNPKAHIDHRADIYALGVMIYQMITGQLPRGVWKPPSQRAQIAPQWDDIVSRAMQSDPGERYQQASDIKSDVSSIPLGAKSNSGASARKKSAPASRSARITSVSPPSKPRVPLIFGVVVGTAVLALGAFLAFRGKPSGTNVTSGTSLQPAPASTAPSATTPTSAAQAGAERSNSSVVTATKDAPFINTLGMKFVPVPITGGPTDGKRVLFSVWETRVQDYAVFVKETNRGWRKSDFEQGPTHPAVHVSVADARAFCAWLTDRERKMGKLVPQEAYRLPSDHEWSCAVGLDNAPQDATLTPQTKNNRGTAPERKFFWGASPLPPPGFGNYAGEERRAVAGSQVIEGWHDEHISTAPVGSYPPTASGLFDMGGNVFELCDERYVPEQPDLIARGSSYKTIDPTYLRAAIRVKFSEKAHEQDAGFRVLIAPTITDP